MRTRKRFAITISVVVALLAASGTVLLFALRPVMPAEWKGIRSGMSREDAHAVLSGKIVDMRDLKGFDVLTRETRMFGDRVYWQLRVTYDQSGRVATAEASYVDSGCGLFNKKPKSVF